MKNKARIIYGIVITIIIFLISTQVGAKIHLGIDFLPYIFPEITLELLLSIGAIYILRKYVDYKISFPEFKKIFRPILFGIVAFIAVNIIMVFITIISGNKPEGMEAFSKMTPIQIFLFVFIYASVVEEILFRGFLMNFLKPLKENGINIFKRKLSLPVLISAILFGLAHLILITTGASPMFLLRIVAFTTTLGLIAGYYQEKYDNNAYAIIVHMSGNLFGVLGSIVMSLNVS